MSDQQNWEGDDTHQAEHLADEQMSLHSKLAGGGRDSGEQASKEEQRLCPACGRVTIFVQGVCSNCDYRPGSTTADAPPFTYGQASSGSPVARIVLIALIILVLAAAGVYAYLNYPRHTATETEPAAEGTAAVEQTETPADTADANGTHPGGLSAVAIDDALRAEISKACLAGNAAWKDLGLDCYVYRFSLFENTVPATSQAVRITGYAGGKDAEQAVQQPSAAAFRNALQPVLDKLNSNAGVTASLSLSASDGSEAPDPSDTYVVYGYYYGLEHWDKIEPVVKALNIMLDQNGQYPDMLDTGLTKPAISTHGGFKFKSSGFGYLPVFKTDSQGHIIMGKGKGLASFMPEECTGYLLVLYTSSDDVGLDLFGEGDMLQYDKTIARFPFEPEGPIRNMPLNPDGKPDGIACVVKTGELER